MDIMIQTHNISHTNEIGETTSTQERVDKDGFDQRVIKRHDNRNTGDLPQFLGALSRVGELKDAQLGIVTASRLDGTPVPGVDSEDAILAGVESPFHLESLPTETAKYLVEKINALEVPERHTGLPDEEPKDEIRRIWTERKSELEDMELAYSDARNALKKKYDKYHIGNLDPDDYNRELAELSVAFVADVKLKLAEISAAFAE